MSDIDNRLQQQIDIAVPWFNEWKITVNPTKTTTILFSNKDTSRINKIKMNNKNIKWSKYLGVTLDQKLTYKT